MQIYIAHTQKISNALSTFCRQYLVKMCLQLTFESVESQLCVMKAVRQGIPSRRTRNSKTPTIETVQSVARYDQLALSGRAQMLTTRDVCC